MSLNPDAVDCSLCSNKEIVQKKINPIFYHSYSLNVLIVRPENRKIELKDKAVLFHHKALRLLYPHARVTFSIV